MDLFIHSNGGNGTVPWRVVSLIREYTSSFAVLVPHHAFSAATLIAMGADHIVMHRMGCLGPIDPSVANLFNPPNPYQPGQPAPISVEDVSAYFKLVKDEVGIHHEDELVQAFGALAGVVHPLALGNVHRHHQQSRLMARKLLRKHMTGPDQEHAIQQIIDHLKSNLFFHGHPINREEARTDLGLKVENPPAELESLMWSLYAEYEEALDMTTPFSAVHEIEVRGGANPVAPAPAQNLPAGMPQVMLQQSPVWPKIELDLQGAYLESVKMTHVFKSSLSLQRTILNTPGGPQEGIRQEPKWNRWEKTR